MGKAQETIFSGILDWNLLDTINFSEIKATTKQLQDYVRFALKVSEHTLQAKNMEIDLVKLVELLIEYHPENKVLGPVFDGLLKIYE